ncbi:MAG: glycosyltransferase family 2 protein [Candidatus Pseudobacter hemicellulosilyticus]|uniref:Glycosyltransferase family 2 protein n=1 Tax=Candidatus Pseudobacter hemicellulosilyticus TaxID=3121375 RepID=A0AAJ6BEB7_9BACT|nr:MAG: glycosyltransferase family 2 protein [Pseudobacter sp.]
MTTPLVSIVILNWNGRHHLAQFLPSVMASVYGNKEVVVIDNASTDDSVTFLRQQYPAVRVVQLERNFGFAQGYNEGLKQVAADYYVLLNSDVEVTPGWIEPVVRLMEKDPAIAVSQPKILQYHNKTLFEYAGAAGGWLDCLGYPFARGRVFDVCETDNGQYDEPAPIFWAGGCAMFVKAAVYQELGGLDNYFFAHQEEIDLCWRVQLAGYKVYACPQSAVYHVGGGTLPKGNARKVFLNFRNNLIMMAKNLPVGEAVGKIFVRFWLDAVSAWKSLLAGEWNYFWAVLCAHVAFFGWLFSGPRQVTGRRDKQLLLNGYLHKSVVWCHFAKGLKTFEEIVGKKC